MKLGRKTCPLAKMKRPLTNGFSMEASRSPLGLSRGDPNGQNPGPRCQRVRDLAMPRWKIRYSRGGISSIEASPGDLFPRRAKRRYHHLCSSAISTEIDEFVGREDSNRCRVRFLRWEMELLSLHCPPAARLPPCLARGSPPPLERTSFLSGRPLASRSAFCSSRRCPDGRRPRSLGFRPRAAGIVTCVSAVELGFCQISCFLPFFWHVYCRFRILLVAWIFVFWASTQALLNEKL